MIFKFQIQEDEVIREKYMKDFSFWEEYEGTPEGSGRSEKI